MRTWLLVLIAFGLVACQSTRPEPSASLAVDMPSPASSLTATPPATPRPSSPFSGEAFEEWVIRSALAGFVEDLRLLYRDPDPDRLADTFTANGLEAAMAVDWRLRASVVGDSRFVGDVSMGGFSTAREEPIADPPSLESDVAIIVAPGAKLIDRASSAIIEAWPERQRYLMSVTLEYDLDDGRWIVTDVGPTSTGSLDLPAPTLRPSVHCPGLAPDQADTADLDESRPWCIGGEDGTFARPEVQISIDDDYPCGQSHGAIITVGWPVGSAIDWWEHNEFVRDPDGRFDRQWPLPIPYRARSTLPKDAYSTGLTDGEFEIWVSPRMGAKAIYAKRSSRVERWPHAPDEWGVIDCN